jgi:ankyrin repeat protein
MQWESTALHYACTWKHFGIAEKLLEQGADADMETPVD